MAVCLVSLLADKMVASSYRLKAVTTAASWADTMGENWADWMAAYSAGSSAVSSAAMNVPQTAETMAAHWAAALAVTKVVR